MSRESVMLAMWLSGEHLDDLETVEEKDFSNRRLIRLLKDGKTALEIGETQGMKFDEIFSLTQKSSEVFYNQALYAYRRDKLKLRLAQGDYKFEEITAAIKELEITMNVVIADKDFAESYNRELLARRKQETAKWSKLPTLTNMTGGIRPKELTTIAARPSVGKSAFALQAAYGAWESGKKVLYFPLEMSKEQTFDRIVQMRGMATAADLRSGKVSEQDGYAYVLDMIDKMEQSGRFLIYESVAQVEKIESAVKKEHPHIVVIDQLTQVKTEEKTQSVRERFSAITNKLKMMAMNENTAVLLLAQINRDAQNTEPTMANLKESGSIEEDSDNVILLHRIDPKDTSDPWNWNESDIPINVNLAKQRSGETGSFVAAFMPGRMTFYEKMRG